MAESVIKYSPKMSVKMSQDEFDPDPSRLCSFTELSRISDKEAEIIHCKNLADYRVKLFGDRKYIIDDLGGEPAKASDYKSLVEQEYLCKRHFNIKYKYSPPPTPKMTFKKIKR